MQHVHGPGFFMKKRMTSFDSEKKSDLLTTFS